MTSLPVTYRRILFFSLVILTTVAVLALAVAALSPGGIGAGDCLLLSLYAITLPWNVIGLWNAVLGLCVMRLTRDPAAAVLPAAGRIRGDEPITARTAILVCIRNEGPARVIRNLTPLLSGLGHVAERFHLFVLSDTSDPVIAAHEEASFRDLADPWRNGIAVTYRRRSDNSGFKAGNIADFCERWGSDYDFALTLDADSFMSAEAVLRLVRIMQGDPNLGILQSLVVGMPSSSAFARIFQFGMRLSMRSYTLGSAWWQADCGPYWGHNALIRLAPFIAHCELPALPVNKALGGHILSHDQVEAALMRRGGFEVRVLPVEDQSWEENPTTLLEFIRRDLRWCLGNMQYWYLLGLPGLKPISRYQFAFAILMFLGSPAWIGLLLIGTMMVALSATPADIFDARAGMLLLMVTLGMWISPKLASLIDILLRPDERRAFGGLIRLLSGVVCSTVFEIILAPIMWSGHAIFLCRLPFGRTVGWIGQSRDDHSVPVGDACRALWPQTLLGLSVIIVLALTHPQAIPYALLLAGGPAISIPLAVVLSWPAVGLALTRIGLGRLPEETTVPVALDALALPAISARATPA